jgi:hypothetical protein
LVFASSREQRTLWLSLVCVCNLESHVRSCCAERAALLAFYPSYTCQTTCRTAIVLAKRCRSPRRPPSQPKVIALVDRGLQRLRPCALPLFLVRYAREPPSPLPSLNSSVRLISATVPSLQPPFRAQHLHDPPDEASQAACMLDRHRRPSRPSHA